MRRKSTAVACILGCVTFSASAELSFAQDLDCVAGDTVLSVRVRGAVATDSNLVSKQSFYAEIADHLWRCIQTNGRYCGFDQRHFIFLLRQAVPEDGRKPRKRSWFSTMEYMDDWTAATVAGNFANLFAAGEAGLPKDAALAHCWRFADRNFSKCEALDASRYGYIYGGAAPSGFEELRHKAVDEGK